MILARRFLFLTTSARNFSIEKLKGRNCKKGGFKLPKKTNVLVSLDESRRFIVDCMQKVGTPGNHAQILADTLVEADYRGIYNYGLKQLDFYVSDVLCKACNPCACPKIIQETKATAWVDGHKGLGAVIGYYCMDVAIEKAKRNGVGWVTVKRSNNFGIAGMYSSRAMSRGYIGICFTNTPPYMCPTRSSEPVLGTNPISVAAHAGESDAFLLDMTTTAVDFAKIEEYYENQLNIPKGWAFDDKGKVTEDAAVAVKSQCLAPLGGSEKHSGYNGYGLGLMVEVLTGVLAGAESGPTIRKQSDFSKPANLGQTFIAIDPKFFAPGFFERMGNHLNNIRSLESTQPGKPVIIHGDKEREHMKKADKDGGVWYGKRQFEVSLRLSKKLEVSPLKARA